MVFLPLGQVAMLIPLINNITMIKNTILLLILINSGQLFAQSFYLKPKIEYRSYQGSTGFPINFYKFSFFDVNYSTKFIPNADLFVKTQIMHHLDIYNIGLNVGMKLKNDDRIEFGWNQDATSSKFNFQDSRATNTIISEGISSIILNHRFEFLYFKEILKSNNENKNLHLSKKFVVFGTGFKFQNGPKKKEQTQDSYVRAAFSYSDYPNSLAAEHYIYSISRFSTFLSLGLSADINFRDKYLFSTSLTYLQGHFVLENTIHYIKIKEDGIITKQYDYTTHSRGSGFMLQISRNFQVYPWKKRKE